MASGAGGVRWGVGVGSGPVREGEKQVEEEEDDMGLKAAGVR